MSTNYTENLGLPQWEINDDVRMEDFNKIGKNVEDGLGYLKRVLLYETVPAFSNITQIEAPLTMIDWEKYDYVDIEFDLKKLNNDFPYKLYFSPIAASSQRAYAPDTTLLLSCLAYGRTNFKGRSRIYVHKNINQTIKIETFTETRYFGYSLSSTDITNIFERYCQKLVFLVNTNDSTAKFTSGGHIKIWGVG